MTTQQQDITFPANTNQALPFTLVDVTGAAINLAGATLRFRLGPYPSGDATTQKTDTDGIAVVNAGQGTITVNLADADIPDSGFFVFDIVVTKAALDTRGKYGRAVIVPLLAAGA